MTKLVDQKIILLGEAVLDLISIESVDKLDDAEGFSKFAGGEVANLAANLSQIGCSSYFAGCVGDDNFGTFIKNELQASGVGLGLIQTSEINPTTLILITRTTKTPDFRVYRGADQELVLSDELILAANEATGIHTSAFALSRDPSRSTILSVIRANQNSGKLISLDPNFHPDIWPDTTDFLSSLKKVFHLFTITKPSLDDAARIFGPGKDPVSYLNSFLDLGPKIVILTMGKDGSILGTENGDKYLIHPKDIPVIDATGAGDAFWTGMYAGLLQKMSALESAKLGQTIAEYKIGHLGPQTDHLTMDVYLDLARERDYSKIRG